MAEVIGKITSINQGSGAFHVDSFENWCKLASPEVVKEVKALGVGATVSIDCDKSGVIMVVKIIKKAEPVAKVEEKKSTPETAKVEENKSASPSEPPKREWTPNKSNYGSPEDISGKEVGCACGCAAQILTGSVDDPETIMQSFRLLSVKILEHLRSLK